MTDRLVTIFGASGFIGRYAVRAFARAGWRVRAAVRRPGDAHFLRTAGVVGQIEIRQTNVRVEATIARALEGASHAVNTVGILYGSGAQNFETLHAEVPGKIGRLAAASGLRGLVHLSAIGARADAPAAYARSKAAGEAALKAAFPSAVILRPSIVFGAEDEFFNRFASLARLSPVLPLFGGGTGKFQPVFVGDVAEAIFRTLTETGHAGQTYELGGPAIHTFRELMEEMLRVTERRRLLLPLPWAAAKAAALASALVPDFLMPPLITFDQVKLLKEDNVVAAGAKGFGNLGIKPRSLEAVLPTYLTRFRKTGEFETSRA